ncbi:MAG: YccF domain-containing protein [Lachnospiraceae bacterium]|nr:YccF domain-containing protein [Lachnospiraceae bacterium]
MKTLGNIIWFIFGGFEGAILWVLVGLLWCVSVVGIPVGVQCLKAAWLVLWPFGKEVHYGGGTTKFIVNVMWIFLGGLELALLHVVIGGLYCVTVVGIPFGLQHFKMAKLALMPLGATVS